MAIGQFRICSYQESYAPCFSRAFFSDVLETIEDSFKKNKIFKVGRTSHDCFRDDDCESRAVCFLVVSQVVVLSSHTVYHRGYYQSSTHTHTFLVNKLLGLDWSSLLKNIWCNYFKPLSYDFTMKVITSSFNHYVSLIPLSHCSSKIRLREDDPQIK